MSDIYTRKKTLDKLRRDEQKRLMAEFDATVYHPGLRALRADCEEEGHSEATRLTRWHDNGFGWIWRHCTKCDLRLDIKGPNGEVAAG